VTAEATGAQRLGLTLSPRALAPRFLLAGALLGVVLAWIAVTLDWAELSRQVSGVARVEPLLLFAVVYTAAFVLRAVAWNRLMAVPATQEMFWILQTSLFLNHVLPVKAGEIARILLAARRGADLADATTTTVLSRVLDLVCLLLLATALFAAMAPVMPGSIVLPTLCVAALAGGLLAVRNMRRGRIAGWMDSIKPVRRFREALSQIAPRAVLGAGAWTFGAWLLEGIAVYTVLRAAGCDVAVYGAIAATAFTVLFQTVHFTPGGIGVYEASMATALSAYGVPFEEALAFALVTHGVKFSYALTVGAVGAAYEGFSLLRRSEDAAPTAHGHSHAGRFEVIMARLWNVANEGKPFTVVFSLFCVALLTALTADGMSDLPIAFAACAAMAPLALIFYRFDFPLKLRSALWAYLFLFIAVFGAFDPLAVAVTLGLYFLFTVVVWGTVYYHLRIGTKWTNGLRFARLVLENPDSTSGNFLEQAPKCLLLVLGAVFLSGSFSVGSVTAVQLFALLVALSAALLHQWFFTWVPAPALSRTRIRNESGKPLSRRFIAIVIDGCRADRLDEARTPFLDRLRAEGTAFSDMETVYPARTVTCFSSMLTGAPPSVHGMRSNFAPRLGVQCQSVFDVLRASGKSGRLVGIAHLIDAFGEKDMRAVSAVMKNELVDRELCEIAKTVLREDDPELLVLQLISVDQTGHARGSYNDEYLRQIEDTDRVIEEFLGWCRDNDYLNDAAVLVTADHGQGIGIGGHGHMSRSEIHVPCLMWGAGVPAGEMVSDRRSVMDVAATISYFLGVTPPSESRGQVLAQPHGAADQSVAIIIPAYNEAGNLPGVLARIPRDTVPGARVIVVDDGSTDATAEVARSWGATVVTHPANRGLGAALRTGLETARDLGAGAAVYVDADGEYDPGEIPSLLAPILAGESDYVIGSRYLRKVSGQRAIRRIGNTLLTSALSILAGRRLTDGQSGFRGFSRRALECAEIVHDYNYAQVLTLDMLRKGMRYTEVPVSYRVRNIGKSFISSRYLWKVPLGIGRQMLKQ
jgi:uncharacterized membrane protein YbhN (UPF0104 family)